MKKVVAYIDGFNFYHSIAHNLPPTHKWLDYKKFISQFLQPGEKLTGIYIFTANPIWDKERMIRHSNYMRILSSLWITVISWNYTFATRKFNGTKMPVLPDNLWNIQTVSPNFFYYKNYEEKQTDVNIALSLFEWGIFHCYDKAIIVTGDSDIAPSIHRVKKRRKNKEFVCILPYKWKWKTMSRTCDDVIVISEEHISNSLLPDEVEVRGVLYKNPYLTKEAKS